MITDLRGVNALRQLRIDHQESAGLDFPGSCETEMLFLYDVCKYLGLSVFQAQEVLGAPAYRMVTDAINSPVGQPTALGQEVLNTLQTS
jgi:hypothetical protein